MSQRPLFHNYSRNLFLQRDDPFNILENIQEKNRKDIRKHIKYK